MHAKYCQNHVNKHLAVTLKIPSKEIILQFFAALYSQSDYSSFSMQKLIIL